MTDSADRFADKRVFEKLRELEQRVQQLETAFDQSETVQSRDNRSVSDAPVRDTEEKGNLEYTIGEFWLAKVGIVILAIGIVFLLTFPYQNLPAALPATIGFILTAFIIILARYLSRSSEFIARYLLGGGLVLFYFSTMRLAFFSPAPLITNRLLIVACLLLVVAINLFVAMRRKSVYLTGVMLTLGYITAIISDQPLILFSLLLILSVTAVFFKLTHDWPRFIIWPMILTYLIHVLWFLNNPIMGHELRFVTTNVYNIYFILGYATVFAAGNLLRKRNSPENDVLILETFLNCFLAYGLFLSIGLVDMESASLLPNLVAGGIFILIAILFWQREKSRYSTFFYAMFGFGAISVAIIIQANQPDLFIWLCWQSLLVIATALWFRSKIIVFANIAIFLIIFIAYLFSAPEANAVSLSFGIVALLSARIMNWQKHRLEIKTELMRNTYLATAFIAFPYALYHAVPKSYVSFAWVGMALFYYILSLVLKNIKYRWMALGTLLLTVFYVLIFGIGGLDPVYRIVSFIVVGTVLLLISIGYSRTKNKTDTAG